ncbi:MAG: hypothetical protein LH479_12070 [Polaromonas sp.]|nr:hypothetical protein [Polaromonas sp.]
MNWLKPNLKLSFATLLGGAVVAPKDIEDRMDEIRSMILLELGEAMKKTNPRLVRTVTYAPEVQDLWYARGEVMAELAAMHGEVPARKKIAHITGMFRGLLPDALNSRPSSLTSQ